MTKMLLSGLLAGCLTLSLTGCGSAPAVVTEVAPILPPESLIVARPEPDVPPNGSTNEDLGDYILRLMRWGRSCESDKTALREWRSLNEN